ncbi:MAG: DUF2235 domain-containing protein [Hyphomicrobiales bacterium]
MSDTPQLPRKRLALFLDGTWNTVGDNTNVWRLKSLCSTVAGQGGQSVYYDPGLGTQMGEKLRGGMFGYGIDKNLQDAYEWLIDKYSEGDEIFLFGFSRGAYTARSLAGFIAMCGLLKPGAPLSINQLYARYRRKDEPRTVWTLVDDEAAGLSNSFSVEDQWVLKYSQRVPIKFVGVWDTVGALGVPAFNIKYYSSSSYGFLHTGLRLPVQHGFHAVAIDEHRKAFSPTLWTKKSFHNRKNAPDRLLSQVEQRWFPGAHGNVGGGYENDLLAQIPLIWIMNKAASLGLLFRRNVVVDGDPNKCAVSDSYIKFMKGIYPILTLGRRYLRRIGSEKTNTPEYVEGTVNESVDGSVFDRWRSNSDYRPGNLAEWASRKGVNIGDLHGAVMAENPGMSIPDL